MSKVDARTRGRKLRASLPEIQRDANDEAVRRLCEQEFEWAKFRRVHLFLPLRRRQEINTWPLLDWIWAQHPRVRTYVPRLVGEELEQVRVTIGTAWFLNRYKIPEPTEGDLLEPDEPLDLILTPLLCADFHGCRVGYGGGYYDKFMARRPDTRRVGLAYESWLTHDDIETNANDVRLDGVVTEKQVHWFG